MDPGGNGNTPRGQAEEGTDEELHHGKAQGIKIVAEAVDDEDMRGKENGASEDDEILRRDGERGRNGNEEQPDRGKSDADPGEQSRFFAEREIEQRHEHHV